LLLDEVLPLVRGVLAEHTEKKLTEQALLRSDAYGKVVASLEETFRNGHLFHTSLDAVLKLSKLKKLSGATA
jgi:hypothetical protein